MGRLRCTESASVRRDGAGCSTASAARARVVALVLAASLAGCGDGPFAAQRSDLARAELTWSQKAPPAYEFDYRLTCFCVGLGVQPVRIAVSGGQVVAATIIETGQAVPESELEAYPTVDSLFVRIHGWLARDPVQVDLSFDPDDGHPTDAFVDFVKNVADEETGFTVRNLQPRLEAPASGELGRQDVHLPDVRVLRQELGGPLHEGAGDASLEVGLAPRRVGEGVEDPERGGVDPEREPGGGPGFLTGQG